MLLAMPSAELRAASAGLVVQLLEEQGREVLEGAAERLKVRGGFTQRGRGKQGCGRGGGARGGGWDETGGACDGTSRGGRQQQVG